MLVANAAAESGATWVIVLVCICSSSLSPSDFDHESSSLSKFDVCRCACGELPRAVAMISSRKLLIVQGRWKSVETGVKWKRGSSGSGGQVEAVIKWKRWSSGSATVELERKMKQVHVRSEHPKPEVDFSDFSSPHNGRPNCVSLSTSKTIVCCGGCGWHSNVYGAVALPVNLLGI